MTRRRGGVPRAAAVVLCGVALVLAGCGDDGNPADPSENAASLSTPTPSPQPAVTATAAQRRRQVRADARALRIEQREKDADRAVRSYFHAISDGKLQQAWNRHRTR